MPFDTSEPIESIQPIGRLIFIRPGALGDTLLAVPALMLARKRWPQASVLFVARADVARLALAAGLADEFSPYSAPHWSTLFAEDNDDLPPDAPARRLIAGGVVIAWLADNDGAVKRNLKRLGARTAIVAPGMLNPAEHEHPQHLAVMLTQALAPLGIATPASRTDLAAQLPPLRATPADEADIAAFWQSAFGEHERVIALHAGSGGAAKRWPPDSFALLLDDIIAHGYTPLLIAGPQDAALTCAVTTASKHSPIAIAQQLALGQLVALLQRCVAYVGNDSGVAHLAGLAGVPTLALFGPSDPAVWAPLGKRVGILRAESQRVEDISVAAVWEALVTLLASSESGSPGSTSR